MERAGTVYICMAVVDFSFNRLLQGGGVGTL